MPDDETAFSILSLNTFGVPPFVSAPRLKRLAAVLDRLSPAVICLQEIQQNAYVPLMQRALPRHPHLAFYPNRFAPKGGLLTSIAAAFPPMEAGFYPYPNRGKPFSLGFSDWALYKGVLLTRFRLRDRDCVVMNTHLQANYLGDWKLSNQQSRIQLDQVKYLVELVAAQPNDAWVVACGDFNFPRQSPVYEWMMSHSGMIDPLADDPRSTYKPFPLVPSGWQTTLDYILCRLPREAHLMIRADIIPIVNDAARWPLQRFLTDHQALVLHLE